MHEAKQNALVIWYDAVTTNGWLEWQNSLTALNSSFFEACDGLFVNYTWNQGLLSATARAAGQEHD